MKQIQSINREQLQISSLDMMVDSQSMVRVLDVFLDYALSHDLGFKTRKRRTGRPSFPNRTLLGIYLYGYLNQVRTSRKLDKACRINIELMWLVKGHKPCYKTIANYRKDNRKAFRKLFCLYREFCLEIGLYGREVVAVDGSKFRAQNSMKNNYNEKKINRHIDYIDSKLEEYLESMDQEDESAEAEARVNKTKVEQLLDRRKKYENLQEQLDQIEDTQISTTDPDARALPLHMRIVEVGYNVQSAVDNKHNLIVDYQVTNKNDSRALSEMAVQSKAALQLSEEEELIVLADKGYHTGQELQNCHDHNIETVVAIPRKPKQSDKTKPPHVQKDKFIYNERSDTYRCPQGQTLTKQATYTRKDRRGIASMKFDRYSIKHTSCMRCPFHEQCVSAGKRKSSQGRCIDRYYTDKAVQRNKEYVGKYKQLYKNKTSDCRTSIWDNKKRVGI